jgi:hypothetical protein
VRVANAGEPDPAVSSRVGGLFLEQAAKVLTAGAPRGDPRGFRHARRGADGMRLPASVTVVEVGPRDGMRGGGRTGCACRLR